MIGILAFGKYYKYWAVNLAASIRYYSPKESIHLITDEKTGLPFFDKETVLKKEDYTKQTERGERLFPCKAKLSLDKYIEEPTLFIDADSIVLRDLSDLKFPSFYNSEVQAYGKKGEDFRQMLWATTDHVIEHFGLKESAQIPALNTSFQYLKPCKELTELFETARKFLDNPLDTRHSEQKWGKGIYGEGNEPDELYMDAALAKCEHKADYPAILHFPFKNSDMRRLFGRRALKTKKEVMNNGFYGLSFAGDGYNMATFGRELYDAEMQKIMKSLGENHVYKIGKLLTQKFIRLN